MAKKKGWHEAFGEMVEETGGIGLPLPPPRRKRTSGVDKEFAAAGEKARETMALLVPHLAKKRRWSDGDCDAVRAILGCRGVYVDNWVHVGPQEAWAQCFLERIRKVFGAITKWVSQDFAREFLLTPNSRMDGRRPLDLLRVSEDVSGKDSFREVLEVFAATRAYSGHPMMVVRDDELVCV